MQLAIFHYHLNRGGVTRVIENHLLGLGLLEPSQRPARVAVFYGGRRDGWNDEVVKKLPFETRLVAIPELDYDEHVSESTGPELSSFMQRGLEVNGFERENTIVHVHNHSLGKNRGLPLAVCELAESGWRLVLQPHDFAEELRPSNYRHLASAFSSNDALQSNLYPQASHVHYAVLNRRDFGVLESAECQNIHLLPNPAARSESPADRQQARAKLQEHGVAADRPYVVYPVRGIRRKNLGELLLWAAAFPDVTFATTLEPKNPLEQTSYFEWKTFSDQLGLEVLFNIGGCENSLTLEENYAAADAIVTTSVAEGFGLVFLEAFQSGLPLFGRDLPGITEDFRRSGMEFVGLSKDVRIRSHDIDKDAVLNQRRELYVGLRRQYGLDHDSSTDQADADDWMDFGRIGRTHQREFIQKVRDDESVRNQLTTSNSSFHAMATWLKTGKHGQGIPANQQVINDVYSLSVIGNRYWAICDSVINSKISSVTLDAEFGRRILDQFVDPNWLFPIRLED